MARFSFALSIVLASLCFSTLVSAQDVAGDAAPQLALVLDEGTAELAPLGNAAVSTERDRRALRTASHHTTGLYVASLSMVATGAGLIGLGASDALAGTDWQVRSLSIGFGLTLEAVSFVTLWMAIGADIGLGAWSGAHGRGARGTDVGMSRAITGLYIGGVLLSVGGAVGTLALLIDQFFGGSSALIAMPITLGGMGVALLGIASGLDIVAGQRGPTIAIAPTDGGAVMTASGVM